MMKTAEGRVQDVMQVCRSGHVITDLVHTCPERGLSHCDRCGAETLDHCQTCGQEILGAVPVPGMFTLSGHLRPPDFCATCGAAFPWAQKAEPPAEASPLEILENFLRRLPRVVRQLRSRHGDRPPLRVQDEHDLEDLARSLLPLYFDDVRLESRTPAYAPGTRTDLWLGPEAVAITLKRASSIVREKQLAEQWPEDFTYYERHGKVKTIIGFVYDPEGLLIAPRDLETMWSKRQDGFALHCIIAV
jgi:hypothetical protein